MEATDAARRHHWNENTYRSHENGTRPLSKSAAANYAKAFKVAAGWLLYGEGDPGLPIRAPLLGYVGAGSQAYFFNEGQGPLDEVELPPGGTHKTVALEARGGSMPGIAEDRWLIYYDDIRTPPTDEMIGRLCVVQVLNGNVLVKKLQHGRKPGHYDLYSTLDPPILDQKLEWAALVTWIKPR